MTILLSRRIDTPAGPITMQVHYYDQYLTTNGGALPRDLGAHALFHYFMTASLAWYQANGGLMVEERELSPRFTLQNAKQLFTSIATWYGIPPTEMTNYWPVVEAQRRALGFSVNIQLPTAYHFIGGW